MQRVPYLSSGNSPSHRLRLAGKAGPCVLFNAILLVYSCNMNDASLAIAFLYPYILVRIVLQVWSLTNICEQSHGCLSFQWRYNKIRAWNERTLYKTTMPETSIKKGLVEEERRGYYQTLPLQFPPTKKVQTLLPELLLPKKCMSVKKHRLSERMFLHSLYLFYTGQQISY